MAEKLFEYQVSHRQDEAVQPSLDYLSDDNQEVQQINTNREVTQKNSNFCRSEKCIQTEIKDNILYEKYSNILDQGPKEYTVGIYDVNLAIIKGQHSNNVLINFEISKEEQVYSLN